MPEPIVHVWLVEDNALYRETIADVIDAAPPHVASAFPSCEEALAALDAGALPDAVLMDIGLPGMGGVEGARVFQARAPAVPVVMLTVHQDTDTIFQAVCAGASGYLLKTATPEAILAAVDEVRAGGAAMDAQIARRVLTLFTSLAAPPPDYGLSERETEILQHLVAGQTKRQIAEALCLSPHTVDGHVRNVYGKLHVHTRGEVVAKALRERLV
ncbi:response regulator transcription factor [Rubrivirga marina]|uniref:response regulator transcription factor n=1 Tax=Rubrivirga marina TaxID=1196024 RepID=UPI000BA8D547|nr:response regulator transcription factor [Rubrivirga marina]